MFPYAMKYIILLNNSFVETIKPKNNVEAEYADKLAGKSFLNVCFSYGDDEFLNLLAGKETGEEITSSDITDMMLFTRYLAKEKDLKKDDLKFNNKDKENNENAELGKKSSNIVLAAVYLILVGQMISILVMYYNRAFMLAFLITIFPLVAMTYVLDKLRRWKESIV